MVTAQLATRTLPEKEPVEVPAHTPPIVEIHSASTHLTAVAGWSSRRTLDRISTVTRPRSDSIVPSCDGTWSAGRVARIGR
jgi:hypothetical protein